MNDRCGSIAVDPMYQGAGSALLASMTMPPIGRAGGSSLPGTGLTGPLPGAPAIFDAAGPGTPSRETSRDTGSGATAFAVTAPPELVLDAQRCGTTSFVVTNLTGRPVRARLTPRGRSGAQDSWLTVDGPTEVSLAVGGTITVAVTVRVPPDVPVGAHTLLLEVVCEDDTEVVTGRSVAFSVPTAPATKRGLPWWLFLIGGLLIAAVAAVVIYLVMGRDTAIPVRPLQPPVVSTTDGGPPRVGRALTATDGVWDGGPVTIHRQWQRCSGPDDCVSPAEANQSQYTPTRQDVGKSLRLVVTATGAGGSATVHSALTAPVAAASVSVPSFIGLGVDDAQRLAEKTGLQLSVSKVRAKCDDGVVRQSPLPGTEVEAGSTVHVTVAFGLARQFCNVR